MGKCVQEHLPDNCPGRIINESNLDEHCIAIEIDDKKLRKIPGYEGKGLKQPAQSGRVYLVLGLISHEMDSHFRNISDAMEYLNSSSFGGYFYSFNYGMGNSTF